MSDSQSPQFDPRLDRRSLAAGVFVAACQYFAIVFGAGFALGPIRILLVVPRLGERWAEFLEYPVMIVVMYAAARWLVARHPQWDRADYLVVGQIAIVLMLIAEFGLVLGLRRMTLSQYFATRDPVSGTVYYALLVLFAALPWLVSRRGVSNSPEP